ESQSETSTFTLMFGLAAWKSSTTACQTTCSSGAPHIMNVISTGLAEVLPAGGGVVGAALVQLASSRLAIRMENSIFFMIPSGVFRVSPQHSSCGVDPGSALC